MKLRIYFPIILFLIFLNGSHQIDFIPKHLRSKYGEALEAVFGIGIRLQALLQSSNNTENFLISPLSAAVMIGQLMLGAEGEFQENLYELLRLPKKNTDRSTVLKTYAKDGTNSSFQVSYINLHLQLGSLLRELKRDANGPTLYTLLSSNALFVNKNIQLTPKFDYESRYLYETEISSVDYRNPEEVMRTVNKWAYDHTKGLISDVLQTPPNANTAGIFTNAIYFLGEWEQPFSDELNTQGPFFTANGKSMEATFMSGFIENIPYSESKSIGCKMIALPYKNRELGMYFVLPNKGHIHEFDMKRFALSTRVADFLDMLQRLKDKDVVVKIPKLDLSTSMSIISPLKKYANYKKATKDSEMLDANALDVLEKKINLYENFNGTDEADLLLTAAAVNGDMRISDLLQQIRFAVNERGTEAAAVTSSIMDYNGGSKSFLANKPFLFFIRHEATAATLFWGAINNPTN